MKKLLLATALTLSIPFTAQANTNTLETCEIYSNIAESVMEFRQMGGDMATLMQKMSGYELSKSLILAAFKKPHYHTEGNQRRAIQDFKNEAFLACYK